MELQYTEQNVTSCLKIYLSIPARLWTRLRS